MGDANKDHACWERPEDMDTARTVLKIDKNNPGSEVAAETAAALASASLVFRKTDRAYSKLLVSRAKRVLYYLSLKKRCFDKKINKFYQFLKNRNTKQNTYYRYLPLLTNTEVPTAMG